MAVNNTERQCNRMKDGEKFQFHKWLDERREMMSKFSTATGIAKAAEKELGFPVTKANVKSALRIVGIDFKPKVRRGSIVSMVSKKVTQLETELATLVEENKTLRHKVENLKGLETRIGTLEDLMK